MAHYFDDIFHRNLETCGTKSPNVRRHHLRRSSTGRSIGARSDFDVSINGDHDDDDDDDPDEDGRSTINSVFQGDSGKVKEKQEADLHMHQYISDQLTRYKDGALLDGKSDEEEFETKA